MTTTKLFLVVLFAAGVIANSGALSAEQAPVDAFGDPLPSGALARMGTVRFRHGGGGIVCAVAYSPDGRFLASGSASGELHVWDAATGKLIRPLVDPNPGAVDIHAIAFSPDGELLASDKGGPGIWQVSTGKRLRDLEDGPAGHVFSMAFSPDGAELALAAPRERTIRVYDPATGKLRRKIVGHDDTAVVAAYSRDGKLLASGGLDKTARVWDAATGKELHRFRENEEVWDVALSPDGKWLAAKTYVDVGLWDVASGKVVRRFKSRIGDGRPLAFSPDGKLLGVERELYDVATGKLVCECDGLIQGPIAFSPDGKAVAGCGIDARVHLFDPATGKELPASRVGWNRGTQNPIGFTPDGKWLVVRSQYSRGAHLCDAATGKYVREFVTDDEYLEAMTLSPDGKTLAGADASGAVYAWETATGKRLFQRKGSKKPERSCALAFAPDGRTLAEAAGENVIRFWDVSTWRASRPSIAHEGGIGTLYFLPDGKTLLSVGADGTTHHWDATGKEHGERHELKGSVSAYSSDGRYAAVYRFEDERSLHLQDIAGGRDVRRIPDSHLYNCAFSPDGKTLAVYAGGNDHPDVERPILLVEVATGKTRLKLAGHRAQEFGRLVFSADGRMLASGSSDMTTLVWDATGRMHMGRLETAVLSPKELSASWAALAGDDAAEAYQAIWTLAAAPDQSLPFLKERLRPMPDADPKETARRLADLDGDDFDVREKAEKELGEQGDLVEPALRKALDGRPSPEVRRRVEELLEQLNGPRWFQKLRAVEALERIGTRGAEKVLQEVAQGPPDARLTVEAKAALERLSRRPTPAP